MVPTHPASCCWSLHAVEPVWCCPPIQPAAAASPSPPSPPLAQVAAEPRLQAIFSELFASSGGCEIYLRMLHRYGLPSGQRLQWAAACEAVRTAGECPVGLLTAGGQLVLAPEAGAQVELGPGDRLVVLAEF